MGRFRLVALPSYTVRLAADAESIMRPVRSVKTFFMSLKRIVS
jgi:hypothetical protein